MTPWPPWNKRFKHTSLVYDNRIWIIGGTEQVVPTGEVWYSPGCAGSPTPTPTPSGGNWARGSYYPNCREACGCSQVSYQTAYSTQQACEAAECSLPACWTVTDCVQPTYPTAAPAVSSAVCEARGMSMLQLAAGAAVCVPRVCDYDTCPQALGTCDSANTSCVGKSGFRGMLSSPVARSTIYCNVKQGGCNAGACEQTSVTTLAKYHVNGVAAVNPSLFGINQNRVAYGNAAWGQGCSAVSDIFSALAASATLFCTAPAGA